MQGDDDDDEYTIPLQHQPAFGAAIKRKRVQFVPESSSTGSLQTPRAAPSRSVADLYLSLVLPAEKAEANTREGASTSEAASICDLCKLPIPSKDEAVAASSSSNYPHEASIAHQVYLEHSHPPSHIDRKRKGLAVLSSYGWDPDSRLGLGAKGQGIQFPIKPVAKDDKLGLGLVVPKDLPRKKEKVEKLDAGKVRKLEARDKKKKERLQEMFYRNDDVQRYLDGGWSV